MINEKQLDRLEVAQKRLERNHAYMAAAVLRLGNVHFTDAIDTAAIVASGDEVRLFFNAAFFDRLGAAELAGVLVHEAMHFAMEHQARTVAIKNERDRYLFKLCCEAVINDLIRHCFPVMELPDKPITGKWLVGFDVYPYSAEEVVRFLRELIAESPSLELELLGGQTTDDHSLWEHEAEGTGNNPILDALVGKGWNTDSSKAVRALLAEQAKRDRAYGTSAMGRDRPVPAGPQRGKDLTRFLLEAIRCGKEFETIWTRYNRKLASVYPQVIIPSYDVRNRFRVLMAIDTSGSVPPEFLAAASAVARQKLPDTDVTSIAFDTHWYEITDWASLKGGGGTRAQAAEEFALQKMKQYPDIVFVLTDGWTPPPQPRHPERWVWILPQWGSATAVPKGCKIERFEVGRSSYR